MGRPTVFPTEVKVRNFRQLDQEQLQQDVSYKCEQLLQSKEHHVAELAGDPSPTIY